MTGHARIDAIDFGISGFPDDCMQRIEVAITSSVALPIALRRVGDGPSVLVVGGTHGDEFEGQIVVAELAREIDRLKMKGTLICVPRHNPRACEAGQRTAPDDDIDINRIYESPETGANTGEIARFVRDRLLPHVDWLIDIHSGGDAFDFVLSGNVQAKIGGDEDLKMRRYLAGFGAPYSIVFDDIGTDAMPHAGTLEAAARAMGVKAISSELGGAGRVTPQSMVVARRGVKNILSMIGVLPADTFTVADQKPVLLRLDRHEHSAFAEGRGVLEPMLTLGRTVKRGDVLARLHPDTLGAPQDILARVDGVLAALQSRGRCDPCEPAAIVCEHL